MFEKYYNMQVGINPLMDVMNVLNICHILEMKTENADFSIIHFDGSEFMKFHKYYIQVYLNSRGNITFSTQLNKCYYKILAVSIQVDYLLNLLEDHTTQVLEFEYDQIKKKVDFTLPPLEIICNFFII